MNNSFDKPNMPDIPLGLGMALAQNQNAMTRFAGLSDESKLKIIEQTHSVNSKREMKDFVDKL